MGTISFCVGIVEVIWLPLKYFRSYGYYKIRRGIINCMQNLWKFAIISFVCCKWVVFKCLNYLSRVKTLRRIKMALLSWQMDSIYMLEFFVGVKLGF